MTKVIYKYPLLTCNQQLVKMPIGARIFDVQIQGRELVLWAAVDLSNKKVDRVINIFMTGEPSPRDSFMENHISTVQSNGIVMHIFDGGELPHGI